MASDYGPRDFVHPTVIEGYIVPPSVDRQKVEGYLAWRYGLNTRLPADHPYKLAPPKKDNDHAEG